MKKSGMIFLLFFLLTISGFSGAEENSRLTGMFIINEDNSHFFGSRGPDEMTVAGLNAFIDQYAGTKVTHLFLCPNAMRANFRSQSRDAIWDPVLGKVPASRWPQNAKLLNERGLDPYKIWIDRSREKGISPWISVRMNDLHSVNEDDNFMHSTFWRSHPEFWRIPHGSGGVWQNRALNFKHSEVRDFTMKFIAELFERYDFDGLELDWMRFGFHLTPGHEKEEASVLTSFMRDVKKLADQWSKKRGHKIELAARVPAVPEASLGLGMDAITWAKEGLVDLLIPCPFWTTSDFDIPTDQWKKLLTEASAKTALAPGMEFNIRSYGAAKAVAADLAALYGFVDSQRARGAENIYLFNWMDSGTRPVGQSDYRLLLEGGICPKKIASEVRRFPLTFHDTVPQGFSKGEQLPKKLDAGAEFKIYAGVLPKSGKASIIIGLRGAKETRLKITLNGQVSVSGTLLTAFKSFGSDPQSAWQSEFPITVLKEGYNVIKVAPTGGIAVWVELRVEP